MKFKKFSKIFEPPKKSMGFFGNKKSGCGISKLVGNRRFPTKGQLAVETLLIYGIAILIVMLAIGALIGFGVLKFDNLLPDNCQLGDLTCENYQVSVTGAQLELRNNLGRNINSISIAIIGEGNNEGLWQSCNATYTGLIVQGELTRPPVSMPCVISVPQGQKIQGVIYANVSLVGSQIPRTIKGNIRATVS
jgi:hypothetical protein